MPSGGLKCMPLECQHQIPSWSTQFECGCSLLLPSLSVDGVNQSNGHVATVSSHDMAGDDSPDIQSLLDVEPVDALPTNFADEQCQDPDLLEIIKFIQKEELLLEEKRARKIVNAKDFDGIEYTTGLKCVNRLGTHND